MSYYDPRPPRRSPTGPIIALAAIGACLLVTVGVFVGWRLRGQDAGNRATPAVSSSLLAEVTPVAVRTIEATLPAVMATTPATPAAGRGLEPPNLAALQAQALDLINQSRSAAGLAPVAWDAAAAELAQSHAEDMLAGQFFSHWNRDGYGPDQRAALVAGMTDAVFENIHSYGRSFEDGQPAPIEDWPQRVLDAHNGLMDSPGHRRNIMDPAHTGVGVGIAYRPEIGELRLVQEFVNQYVELDPLPAELSVGAEVEISGRLLNGASDPLINLAYEPMLAPLSAAELARTSTYRSAAQFFSAPRTTVDGDRFHTQAFMDRNGETGLYHVWVFVTVDGQQALAAAPIIVAK